MSLINILSPHVADMIAAGEVVERPASVVKELMENAFDAGASTVTVEIKGGGATYIRVSDDGSGMSPEDAGLCFTRHATSKLKDEYGLEAIGTMGFRGEALAAIASVSEVELYTRRHGDDEGTYVSLVAGDIQDMSPVGCSAGTVMIVKNLFFNTPARLKFLKSDRSEATACQQTALRCALGRPGVSVRFIKDGREEFFSPGDGKADSCLYSLLGRDLARDMLPCSWDDGEMKLSGFVCSPAAARGNRSAQYFYVNSRYIRSAMLQSAVEQAFKNRLLPGRYPACVMYLDLSFASVDVNVHPAKTEVKFSQERRVFDLVYQAVMAALDGEDRLGSQSFISAPQPTAKAQPKADFYKSMSAQDYLKQQQKPAPAPAKEPAAFHAYDIPYQTRLDMSKPMEASVILTKNRGNPAPPAETGPKAVEKPVQNVEKPPVPDYKIIGEALKLYIIVEHNDGILLIDKHAAHERIIFDALKARGSRSMSQTLLTPVTLRLEESQRELIELHGELLNELGYELEEYGESEYILRAVPADMHSSDALAAMEEILEMLRQGKAPDADSQRDEILHTTACKAAIKAGYTNDPLELKKLADAVLSGQVRYCPHGRPVSVRLERKDLDKLFKRIV